MDRDPGHLKGSSSVLGNTFMPPRVLLASTSDGGNFYDFLVTFHSIFLIILALCFSLVSLTLT